MTSGIGSTSATVTIADSALIAAGGTASQSWFVAASSEPVKSVALQAGVKNYLELSLAYVGDNELLRAFWDATANGGVGAEFNALVETIKNLEVTVNTSITGFSGDANTIPISIVETNGGGSIVSILDHRDMFWRLGQAANSERNFPWGTIEEPSLELTLSGITGVFVEDEVITFDGSETATVVSFAGSLLKVKDISAVTFSVGDAIVGAASGASGTLAQALDSFTGADKDIKNLKEMLDALMTEIKVVKGTKKWFEEPQNSLVGMAAFMNSQMVQATSGAKFSWDGSELEITDGNATPLDSDVVGYLRQMGKATDMSFTRQSKGLEIQHISFSAVPDTGSITLEHAGDTSDTINAGDDATAVQTAINAQWTSQVTVTGDFSNGFTITFDVAGSVAEMTEASNTLQASNIAVTSTISTVQEGYSGGAAIPIGLDQVMFVKIPSSGDRSFDAVGSSSTNYQVLDRDAFEPTDENYWIAFNEGGVLYLRDRGELEAGEESAISDPDKETILNLIDSNSRRVSQDRTAKLIEGGVWSLAGNSLTLSATAFLEVGGLEKIRNSISAQTITLPNADSVAYVKINRDGTGASTIHVQIADVEDVILTDNVFIIARKVSGGVLVGNSCFLLKDGEFLELDGALAEINRYMGQLKLNAHESDADKARISAADVTLLDSSVLSQELNNFILSFEGAVIDFTTGAITESDGLTPLGNNFSPFSIPVGEFFWYGIALLPGNLTVDNRQLATVQVTLATASNAVKASAPASMIVGDKKLGSILVQNVGGSIELSEIRRLGVGSGSGSGSGQGRINYILNPEAETYLGGWEGYADAAGPTPVDGTGGSPNSTLTRDITTPLRAKASFVLNKDVANRQGEGVSYDFAIDRQDVDSKLFFSLDGEGSTNFVEGDIEVFIYDIDNTTLITPAKTISSKEGISGSFKATNSLNYRLIIHIATVNPLAYTFEFDNVFVGPDEPKNVTYVQELVNNSTEILVGDSIDDCMAANIKYAIKRESPAKDAGIVWTSRTSAADNPWADIAYGNGLFVAVAYGGTGNRVMTSPDGINWTIRTNPVDNDWRSVTYGNGLFVAVSTTGTGNRVMTSPDGINWTIRTSAADNSWRGVTYGNGLFVAVAPSGIGTGVMTSPDGINWTIRTSAANNSWTSVTYGNGLFVAVSYTGAGDRVMTSPDGINWTIRTSAADNEWGDVTYGNGLFVAVAYSGTGNRVMTSPDGINWTSRTSAADNNWTGITHGNEQFVAVAISGIGTRVMTSPDGINWALQSDPTLNNWSSVAHGEGLFVAVSYTGAGDRVMTSPEGVLPVNLLASGSFRALNKNSNYSIESMESSGDVTGVDFSINGSGVISYTSDDLPDQDEGEIRYKIEKI